MRCELGESWVWVGMARWTWGECVGVGRGGGVGAECGWVGAGVVCGVVLELGVGWESG